MSSECDWLPQAIAIAWGPGRGRGLNLMKPGWLEKHDYRLLLDACHPRDTPRSVESTSGKRSGDCQKGDFHLLVYGDSNLLITPHLCWQLPHKAEIVKSKQGGTLSAL